MILPEMRKIIPVSSEILSSSFLSGLYLRRFANLSEQELNQLALGNGPTQQQTCLYQPFKVSNTWMRVLF